MADKTVLHTLKLGLVLDRSVFAALPATDMAYVINNIRASKDTPLYVVDGAEAFFTTETLMVLMGMKDHRALLINEALGNFFTDKQLGLLMGEVIQPAVLEIEKDPLIVDLGNAPKPAGGYVFAAVPAGWTVSGNMSLGPTKIKRKMKNADGDGTMFAMAPESFENLWKFASKAWAGIPGAKTSYPFPTQQGKLIATIFDDRISLGGNYVRRYEIEQIAKYRNWAMPELQAA